MMRWLYLFFATSALAFGCEAELLSNVEEGHANRVLAALHQARIPASKAKQGAASGGFSVRVREDDLGAAVTVVAAQGLGGQMPQGLNALYDEAGLVPSASQDAARLAAALGGELAQTISAMKGVLAARVHVAPSPPRGRAPHPPGEASVYIRSDKDAMVSKPAVQTLVAGAVPGLEADGVRVVVEQVPTENKVSAHALTWVGPFVVGAQSAGPLRAALAISLAFNLAAATVLGWLLWKRRQRRVSP